MKFSLFLILILTFLLTSCGGGSDGAGKDDGGDTTATDSDPWKGIWAESLSAEEVTDQTRVLSFSDGMTVSYDGSFADGNEEVCRRELVDGIFYEVCMPLEDDPFFVPLANNAMVWHPLMFERFAVELTCRQWMEGDADKTVAGCDEILPLMGGEGFRCEAGLVDGDKALKCSDDWAVVVNGEDDAVKSVCRVLLSDGSGRCLGAPKDGVADSDLILEMQKSSWDGYRSVRDNNHQFGVGDTAMPLPPQELPEGANISYWSVDESICTVDMGGGVMILPTIAAPEMCKVYLQVEASGFVDRVLFAELAVLKDSDVQWGNYTRINNYFYPGETLEAGPVVSSDPTATKNEYKSLDEAICTVDGNTGAVTAVATGECVIRLSATAENYLDAIIDRTIPVDIQTPVYADIVWDDFDALDAATAVVGADISPLTAPVVKDTEGADAAGAVLSYHVTGDCAYDSSSRVISFADVTECVVEVTAVSGGRSEAPLVKEFRFTPGQGSFTLTWTGYAASAEYGSSAPALTPPATTPADLGAGYSYAATGEACEVDEATGALTILAAGSCEVTLSADVSGYAGQSQVQTVTVAKKPQGLTAPDNPYGGAATLKNGETLEMINPPTGGIGEVAYGVTSGTCTVDGAGGAVTGGAASGNCVVKAKWTGDENNAESADVDIATIAMVAAGSDAPVWSSSPYGSNPLVDGAAVALANGAISNTGVGAAEYRSATLEFCTVAADGSVTGIGAGTCRVEARFVGDATNGASAWTSLDVTVEKGVHPALGGSNYYGATGEVATNGNLDLVAPPEGQGAATYSSASENYCTVDPSTGVVTGVAKGSCTIQVAFAGDDNYEPLAATDLQVLTVTDLDQTLAISNPYDGVAEMMVGDILALVNAPTATLENGDTGGAITYQIATASAAVCTVAGDGTVTATAVGECVVQVQVAGVSGYNSMVRDIATIGVETGRFTFSWNPYKQGVSYRAGGEGAVGAVDIRSTGATVVYRVVDAGDTGCALKQDGITLTFDNYGVCRLGATASKEHYESWSAERILRVRPGAISVEVGAFGENDRLMVEGSSQTPSAYANLNPSDAEIAWELVRGESDCVLLDEETGEVEALVVSIDENTKCSLQLVASKEGYDTFRSGSVEIPLTRGDLERVIAPVYGAGGGKLSLSEGHIDMERKPFVASSTMPIFVESVAVAGYESNGTTGKANVCEVQNDVTMDHFGRVSVGSAAAAGDVCKVVVTVRAVGFNPLALAEMELTLVSGELEFGTALNPDPATQFMFDGSLKIGPDVVMDISHFPDQYNTDEDGGTLPITWEFRGEWVSAVGKEPYAYACLATVNRQDQDELFLIASSFYVDAGDSCIVHAIAQVEGYGEHVISLTIPIVAGDLTFADNSNKKILYSGNLRLGDRMTYVHRSTYTDDRNISVTWGSWRVMGFASGTDRTDGTEDAEKADVCAVDSAGTVSAGPAAGVGDICEIYAVASKENWNDIELLVGILTIEAVATFGSLTGPLYNGDLALRGLPLEVDTAPVITGAGADEEVVWTYTILEQRTGEAEGDICSIDENTGAVSLGSAAILGDECFVIATAHAPGYVSQDAPAVALRVHDTFASLTWANFPTTGAVGVPINLSSNQPVSVPAADSYTIETAGDCAYNTQSQNLTFSDTTLCVVTVTAVKTNYLNFARTFSITPAKGTIAVTWGSYGSVVYGAATSAATLSGLTPSDATKTYSVTGNSPGCTVVAATGVVTGTAAGSNNCNVKLVLSRTGYTNAEHTYTMSVKKASQTFPTWNNPYGSSPTVTYGLHGVSPLEPQSPPSGQGALKYRVASGDTGKCLVLQNGGVAASAAGAGSTCTIEARFAGNANYKATSYQSIATITVRAGTISVSDWGTYNTLKVGGSATAPTVTSDPATSRLTKTYSQTGLSTPGCTADNSGTLSGAVVGSGNCKIKLTLSVNGYTSISHTYSLDVVRGVQNTLSWSEPYGSGDVSVAFGDSTGITPGAAPTGLGSATVEYQIEAGDRSFCTVGASSGQVLAQAAGIDEDCVVQARFRESTNYVASSVWTDIATVSVVAGTISVTSWGSYEAVVVGAETEAPSIGTTTPSGVTKAYALATDSSGCTLNTTSGAVTGTASGTDNCKITLTLTANNYDDLTHTYSISVGLGEQEGISWVPGSLSSDKDDDLTLNAISGAHSSATLAYAVTSAGTTGCAFKAADGNDATAVRTLTFTAAGTCKVRATVTRSEYNPWNSAEFSVTVTERPPVGIVWTGYANSNRIAYGAQAINPEAPTLTPTSASPTYSHTGDGCSVTSAGVLTPVAVGTCEVTLRATANNFEPGTAVVTVTVVKATQSAPTATNIYGSPSLVTGGTHSKTGSLTGGQGSVGYRSGSATICAVDGTSGDIVALRDGSCVVEARWEGNGNYEPSAWVTIQTITIGLGTLTIDSAGSFTGNLPVGGTLIPGAPTTTPPGATFSYALKQGETDCTLVSTTTGEIQGNSVTIDPGVTACTLVVTARLTGYGPATAELSVNLVEVSPMTFATAPAYPDTTLARYLFLEVGALPSTDDNNVGVTWNFSADGTRSGAAQTGVCSVDNDSQSDTFGDVTAGESAAVGDICTITVTGTPASAAYETWSETISLTLRNLRALQISVVKESNCVVFEGGKLKCWGNNQYGKLGYGDTNHRGDGADEMGSALPFVDVGSGRSAKYVSVGGENTCVILDDDSLKCWGSGFSGVLGNGGYTSKSSPPTSSINLGEDRTARKFGLGTSHICAILDNHTLKCWGWGITYGELGYGSTHTFLLAPHATDTVNVGTLGADSQLAAEGVSTCASLDNGSLKCWGNNDYGQLGVGDTTSRNVPTAVDLGERTVRRLSAGYDSVCAILDDGSLVCWGRNNYGQLGVGDTNDRNTPTAVSLGNNVEVVSLSVGRKSTCVILNDSSLRCWGYNVHGQLGFVTDVDITHTPPSAAVNLGTNRTAREVAVGLDHTCAILDDYTVKCWGTNFNGVGGRGTDTSSLGNGAGEMGDSLPVVELPVKCW